MTYAERKERLEQAQALISNARELLMEIKDDDIRWGEDKDGVEIELTPQQKDRYEKYSLMTDELDYYDNEVIPELLKRLRRR